MKTRLSIFGLAMITTVSASVFADAPQEQSLKKYSPMTEALRAELEKAHVPTIEELKPGTIHLCKALSLADPVHPNGTAVLFEESVYPAVRVQIGALDGNSVRSSAYNSFAILTESALEGSENLLQGSSLKSNFKVKVNSKGEILISMGFSGQSEGAKQYTAGQISDLQLRDDYLSSKDAPIHYLNCKPVIAKAETPAADAGENKPDTIEATP